MKDIDNIVKTIYEMLKIYQTTDNKILKKKMGIMINFGFDTAQNGKKNLVSKAAIKKVKDFRKTNPKKHSKLDDLTTVGWDDLGGFKDETNKSGNGSRALIWEHYIPCNYLRKEFYKLDINDKNILKKIKKIIDKTIVCVITHEEDAELRRLKFNHNRRYPAQAYKKAKIKPSEGEWPEIDCEKL